MIAGNSSDRTGISNRLPSYPRNHLYRSMARHLLVQYHGDRGKFAILTACYIPRLYVIQVGDNRDRLSGKCPKLAKLRFFSFKKPPNSIYNSPPPWQSCPFHAIVSAFIMMTFNVNHWFKVDAQTVIEQCKDHIHKQHSSHGARRIAHQSWSRDEDAASVSKYTMPKVGIPSRSAYQLLHDDSALDGNPLLNLASWVVCYIFFLFFWYKTISFVHTWMPPDADKLIMENINKNIVDMDEYPAASIIHNRCISMSVLRLFLEPLD